MLLVTLKAWQVSDAVKSLAAQLPESTPILLIHNGMGTIEELKSVRQPLLMGTTTTRRVATVTSLSMLPVVSLISVPRVNSPAITAILRIPCKARCLTSPWHNNIRAELWRKLAVNCAINPLTALLDCPNGELRQHPDRVALICREVAAVIEREGYHTAESDLRYYVDQVIESTAENISSMLQDIRAMRHTEIDYITGYLLKRARAHGITVAENSRLFELVKRKESEYERIGTGMPRPW